MNHVLSIAIVGSLAGSIVLLVDTCRRADGAMVEVEAFEPVASMRPAGLHTLDTRLRPVVIPVHAHAATDDEADPAVQAALLEGTRMIDDLNNARWTALDQIGATPTEIDAMLVNADQAYAAVEPYSHAATIFDVQKLINTAQSIVMEREQWILGDDRAAALRDAILEQLQEPTGP